MKPSVRRVCANFLADRLYWLMPKADHAWACAMAAEIGLIEADGAAFRFAIGCVWVACRASITAWWGGPLPILVAPSSRASSWRLSMLRNRLGMACGSAATLLGCAVMAHLGAPVPYIVMNFGALLFALATVSVLPSHAATRDGGRGWIALGAGLVLLAFAAHGLVFDKPDRWVRIGGIALQPTMVLVPWMVVALARRSDWEARIGIACAAAAIAVQGDVALSSALLCGLLPGLQGASGRLRGALLAWAVVCWGLALLRSQPHVPLAYVDGVVAGAFVAGLAPGLTLCVGLGLMLAPTLPAWSRGSADVAGGLEFQAFGAFWVAAVGAALCTNGQTPLVGFGGSAVLGYFLSLTVLQARRGLVYRDGVHRKGTGHAQLPVQPNDKPSADLRLAVSHSAFGEITNHHHQRVR
jgi:hypothetical protein